jgi:hypothetical protein
MQTEKSKALGMCFVCGHAFSANDRLVFENARAMRHHSCSKDKLVNAVQKQAEARSCTPRELLVMRLAEMQRRIICALGEVSFEQFCNPGPQGYVTLRLSERGFDISVEFRPSSLPGAIYHEALIAPGSLQQRKAQLLAQVRENAPQQGLPMGEDLAKNQMIEQLRSGEDHWDGRKKADLSLEILSAEGMAFKALSFVEKDPELAPQAFAESPLILQQVAQQILDRLGLQDAN